MKEENALPEAELEEVAGGARYENRKESGPGSYRCSSCGAVFISKPDDGRCPKCGERASFMHTNFF